jgi:hypothetical protein
MKKFLFTLASLVMVGFAANANEEKVALSESEITLAGGETQEVVLSVVDKPYALINGVQYNFTMFDENGQQLAEGCHLELLPEYGTADAWAWFGLNMVGANGTVYNNGTAATSSNGTYHQTDTWDDEGDYMPINDYGVENVHVTYTGKYNVILANVQANQVYTTRMKYPLQVLKLTVKVDEGWTGNYATLRLVMREYSYSDGTVDRIEDENGVQECVLKINNGSAVTPVAPEAPVVTFVENGDVLTVTVTAEDGATLTVNGQEVDSPYSWTVNRTYAYQTIDVVATATRDDLSATTDTTYVMAPLDKKPVDAPTFSTTMDDDSVYVTITWPAETDGEHKYTGEYAYPRLSTDYSVPVQAWVEEGTEWLASDVTNYTVEVPNNWTSYTTEAPDVNTELTDDALVITATGDGVVTLYVTVYDPLTGAPTNYSATGDGSATYSVERGDVDLNIAYYATAVEDGSAYDEYTPGVSQSATAVVPAKPTTPPVDQVGAPTFLGYTEDGITGYGVTINPTTPGSHIKYQVYKWDAEANDGEGEWVLIEPLTADEWLDYDGDEHEIWYTELGKYRVVAYAWLENMRSEEIGYEFVVTPYTPPTSIDEMNAGKTIAGVRYFNMAGQEMQEANGMTIVVTTYTDGTTSAVKVMK